MEMSSVADGDVHSLLRQTNNNLCHLSLCSLSDSENASKSSILQLSLLFDHANAQILSNFSLRIYMYSIIQSNHSSSTVNSRRRNVHL